MDEAAVALDRVAQQAMEAQEVVAAQRAALGRYALVWWTGEAAERYLGHVERRRAALARCADELGEVAALAARLGEVARAEAGALRTLGVAA